MLASVVHDNITRGCAKIVKEFLLFIYSFGFFFFWHAGGGEIRGKPSTCACGGVRVEEFVHLRFTILGDRVQD